MRSTLAKNDLKYLNISIFDHFIPILRKNLRFEAKIKKKKKKDHFFVLHPNFTKIWYVKDKTPNFNVSNFFSIRMTQKNGPFLIFFLEIPFFTFQVWPFWSDKITNLRLPKHNLGGYYYNKVVLEFWNFYFLGVKSAIFE